MVKELQLLSSDYKRAVEYKKQHSLPCGPLEKIWTAKVVVPPEEFQMPQRERLNISRHVERMHFARALGNKQHLPAIKRLQSSLLLSGGGLAPTATDKAGEGKDGEGVDHCNDAHPGEREEAASKATKRQEIKMDVTFKSEEPKRCIMYHPNALKPFFPTKKVERSITGLTNRSLWNLAEFPGDLMLMSQNFISRGVHASDVPKANRLEGDSAWKEDTWRAASHLY